MMLDLSSRPARIVFGLLLLGLGFFLFFPLYWTAVSALKPNAELYRVVPTLVPATPTFEHFRTALTRGNLPLHLQNSLLVSTAAALINTALALHAGYAFAKFRFAGRRVVMLVLLSAQVFPFGLLLISIHPLLTDIGLLDTRTGLVLSYIVFALPVSTYMFFSYFAQVPGELIEAARADGASELRVLYGVVLPLSVPAVVTVFLYAFMWAWNDLLYALTLVVSEEKRTVGPGLLLSYLNETSSDWGGAMAASLVASAPVILAFAALQRWFVQGITAGAVK
jgi:multiple sugar transport system permease protein